MSEKREPSSPRGRWVGGVGGQRQSAKDTLCTDHCVRHELYREGQWGVERRERVKDSANKRLGTQAVRRQTKASQRQNSPVAKGIKTPLYLR